MKYNFKIIYFYVILKKIVPLTRDICISIYKNGFVARKKTIENANILLSHKPKSNILSHKYHLHGIVTKEF